MPNKTHEKTPSKAKSKSKPDAPRREPEAPGPSQRPEIDADPTKTREQPEVKRSRLPKTEIGETPSSDVPEIIDDGSSRDVPDVGERPASSDDPRRVENDGTDIERAEPGDVVGGEDIERGPTN